MNSKIIKVIGGLFILIVCSMIINIVYAFHMSLDEVVVLKKHDYVYLFENDTSEHRYDLHYIQDVHDQRMVTMINFDGLNGSYYVNSSQGSWIFQEVFQSVEGEGGRYYNNFRRYVDIAITDEILNQVNEVGELIITDAELVFNDGSTQKIDIGSIEFFKAVDNDNFIEAGISSSEHRYGYRLKVSNPIQVTGFDLSTFEKHKNDVSLEVTIDAQDVYDYEALVNIKKPIQVNRQVEIRLESNEMDVNQKWRFFETAIGIIYDNEGEQHVYKVPCQMYDDLLSIEETEAYITMWRKYNE